MREKRIILVVSVLLLLIVIYIFFIKNNENNFETIQVVKGDIVSEIFETGIREGSPVAMAKIDPSFDVEKVIENIMNTYKSPLLLLPA